MFIQKNFFSILLLIALLGTTFQSWGTQKKRPNFIIIYIDDLGYSDLGIFSDQKLNTPAIDQLVASGQSWTDFYATSSVCSPSRGALLTGNLPVRSGLYGDQISVFWPGSAKGIPQEYITLPEIFQQNDYATAIFGKWHLGDASFALPTRHGFDEWLGIPYSNDMDWEVEGITSTNIFQEPALVGKKWEIVGPILNQRIMHPQNSDWHVPLQRSVRISNNSFNDEIIERPADQTQLSQRYTKESIEFIRRTANAKKPFFLLLSHSMPHVPLFSSQPFVNKSVKGLYGDVLEEIDWSLGAVMRALEKAHIVDNTYIVFTSDNGPWLRYKDHAGSAAPLRGGKGTSYEGGVRVMTIFKGPRIQQGISNELGAQTDIYNTFLSLAGIEHSKEAQDSFDLSITLTTGRDSPRQFIPYYSGSELRAFRVGMSKLHFVTADPFDKNRILHDPPILTDLKNDIGETKNVAALQPETLAIVQRKKEQFLKQLTIKASILDRQYHN